MFGSNTFEINKIIRITGKYIDLFNKGIITHSHAIKVEKISPNKGVEKLTIKKINKNGIKNPLTGKCDNV